MKYSQIARELNISRYRVVDALKDIDYGVCARCGKRYKRKNAKQWYCRNPCTMSAKREFGVYKWALLRIMRSDIAKLARSSPPKALKLERKMRRQEGDEFTDLVFSDILKTEEFHNMKKIYNRYEKNRNP